MSNDDAHPEAILLRLVADVIEERNLDSADAARALRGFADLCASINVINASPGPKTTVLGGDLTAASVATQTDFKEARRKEDGARILARVLLESFQSGTTTLEDLMRRAATVSAKAGLMDGLRQKMLGAIVEAAIGAERDRPRGHKKRPQGLGKLCAELATIANAEEGLPLSRAAVRGGTTAFDRVAGILSEAGYAIGPRQVEDARAAWLKTSQPRD